MYYMVACVNTSEAEVRGTVFTLLFLRNLRIAPKARALVPGKPFQPSLMFVSKAGASPNEASFICSTLRQTLVLPTNIRLGCKGLPGTNTLA